MWAEHTNEARFDTMVWPHGSVVSERLWTARDRIQTVVDAEKRLERHTCFLASRGFARCAVLCSVWCMVLVLWWRGT